MERADAFLLYLRAHRRALEHLPEDWQVVRDAVSILNFEQVEGYLKGFIDLIFEHRDRWYLVDYKSNFLGERFSDYTGDHLTHAMSDHNYFLQYHIYTVALHRYLAWRMPGYDYNIHFGGVYYLFIRGMSPETGPDCGIFRDRPSLELIQAMSTLF